MKRLTTAALAVLTVLVIVFSLTACGGKAVTLTVHDKDAKTEVEANVGMTVSQVLEKAEIKLGEKDETEPAKDEKIAEDTKEITIKRYAKVTVKLGDESREIEMTGGTVADAIKTVQTAAKFDVRNGQFASLENAEVFTLDGKRVLAGTKGQLAPGAYIAKIKGVSVKFVVK